MEGQGERERPTAKKRGQREVDGKKTVKSTRTSEKEFTGQRHISDCRWGE